MDDKMESGKTGLEIAVDKLIGLYSRANVGVTIAAYAGRVIGGTLVFDETEVRDAKFFARAELPAQPPPTTGKLIDQWFYELVTELFARYRKADLAGF